MCEHATYEFSPEVNVIAPPEDFTFVAVQVRCAECHEQFHWRGISSGLPNSGEPTVTADGYTLLAPIAPGPGAVVGLLVKAGLQDHLVDPKTKEER